MRRTPTGMFELPLPAAEAIRLFTPEGERDWAPGWDPHYVLGEASEAPGTVFTTAHGADTIWVIVDIGATSATYARITPGHHAGLVQVNCADSRPGLCTVTVSYDLSPLGQDHGELDVYAPEPFAEMMAEWATAITSHLESR